MNPCVNAQVDTRLVQRWHEENADFYAKCSDDESANQTIRELNHLHHDGPKGANRTSAIQRQIARIWKLERDLFHDSAPSAKKTELTHDLKTLLSRRAPYTAMVRSAAHPDHLHLFD